MDMVTLIYLRNRWRFLPSLPCSHSIERLVDGGEEHEYIPGEHPERDVKEAWLRAGGVLHLGSAPAHGLETPAWHAVEREDAPGGSGGPGPRGGDRGGGGGGAGPEHERGAKVGESFEVGCGDTAAVAGQARTRVAVVGEPHGQRRHAACLPATMVASTGSGGAARRASGRLDAKRSCRRWLTEHNERRWKSNASEAMARGIAHSVRVRPSV